MSLVVLSLFFSPSSLLLPLSVPLPPLFFFSHQFSARSSGTSTIHSCPISCLAQKGRGGAPAAVAVATAVGAAEEGRPSVSASLTGAASPFSDVSALPSCSSRDFLAASRPAPRAARCLASASARTRAWNRERWLWRGSDRGVVVVVVDASAVALAAAAAAAAEAAAASAIALAERGGASSAAAVAMPVAPASERKQMPSQRREEKRRRGVMKKKKKK